MTARMLADRVAAITGAGGGLGRAMSEHFARAGATVVVLEISPDAGRETVRQLHELGARAELVPVDVSSATQVSAAFAHVQDTYGRLDILVNNAGIDRIGPHTHEVTDADWHDALGVLQTGVFYGMREAGKIMVPQGSGSVINISSIRGFSPMPGRMTYSPAKAAVIMMTRVAAAEWGPHGVRVNAIAPGFTRTPMHDAGVARGTIDEDHYVSVIPARRLGMPDDVAALAVFLCSDAAAYITGACITIDGGLTSIAVG